LLFFFLSFRLLSVLFLSFRSEAQESALAFPNHSDILSSMPPREYHFYVYIMASRSHDLYVGFTNNVFRRIAEHRTAPPGTYNINRLVYYEHFA